MIDGKNTENKMLGEEKEIIIKEVLQSFFFPDYNLTILAVSQEEANKKLLEIIKTKTNV